MTADIITKEALKLPLKDRIRVIQELLNSIPTDETNSHELSQELEMELKRCSDSIKSPNFVGYTWESVKKRITNR
ncbi:MAG: hypothetical protein ACPGVB_12790 [Chitinophagales bacterium]